MKNQSTISRTAHALHYPRTKQAAAALSIAVFASIPISVGASFFSVSGSGASGVQSTAQSVQNAPSQVASSPVRTGGFFGGGFFGTSRSAPAAQAIQPAQTAAVSQAAPVRIGGFFGSSSALPTSQNVSSGSLPASVQSSPAQSGISLFGNFTSILPIAGSVQAAASQNQAAQASANVPSIVIPQGTCNTELMDGLKHFWGARNPSDPPYDVSCRTINKMFVGEIEFRMPDGKCYYSNWNGTRQIACKANTPELPNNRIPDVLDTSFNWTAANAECYYTRGSGGVGEYGVTRPMICGYVRGTPTPGGLPDFLYNNGQGMQGGTGTMSGTPLTTCDQTRMNETIHLMGTRNPRDPSYDISCKTIGQAFIGKIEFQGTDGRCYRSDWNTTVEIACNASKMPPQLVNGRLPSVYDGTFPWANANAKCYYTRGSGGAGEYGMTREAICGGFHSIPDWLLNQ